MDNDIQEEARRIREEQARLQEEEARQKAIQKEVEKQNWDALPWYQKIGRSALIVIIAFVLICMGLVAVLFC